MESSPDGCLMETSGVFFTPVGKHQYSTYFFDSLNFFTLFSLKYDSLLNVWNFSSQLLPKYYQNEGISSQSTFMFLFSIGIIRFPWFNVQVQWS